MRWPPNVLDGLFYDSIDSRGVIYWFEPLKHKMDEEQKFKELLLKGLGFKITK